MYTLLVFSNISDFYEQTFTEIIEDSPVEICLFHLVTPKSKWTIQLETSFTYLFVLIKQIESDTKRKMKVMLPLCIFCSVDMDFLLMKMVDALVSLATFTDCCSVSLYSLLLCCHLSLKCYKSPTCTPSFHCLVTPRSGWVYTVSLCVSPWAFCLYQYIWELQVPLKEEV